MGIESNKSDFEDKLGIVMRVIGEMDSEYEDYLKSDIDSIIGERDALLADIVSLHEEVSELEERVGILESESEELRVALAEAGQ